MKSFYQLNEEQQQVALKKIYTLLLQQNQSTPTNEEVMAYAKQSWYPGPNETLIHGVY